MYSSVFIIFKKKKTYNLHSIFYFPIFYMSFFSRAIQNISWHVSCLGPINNTLPQQFTDAHTMYLPPGLDALNLKTMSIKRGVICRNLIFNVAFFMNDMHGTIFNKPLILSLSLL